MYGITEKTEKILCDRCGLWQHEAGEEIDALRARVAELERDAARYEYLRNFKDDSYYHGVVCYKKIPRGPVSPDWEPVTGKKLDAAIDAAMEKADET